MDTLFTLPAFLSPTACHTLVEEAEERGFTAAPITTSRGFVMAPDIRNNTRVMVDDAALAEQLFARLAPYLAPIPGWTPVGLNERFRYYRYERSEAFRWHRDGSFHRDMDEMSLLTFMVYLNDDFDGGRTEFDDPPQTVVPATGLALVFAHRLRHQGAEVRSGTKYVLRSDVMYRRACA
jgi:hypothetical protein